MSSSIIGFDRFVLVRSFAFVRRSSSIQKSLFFYLKLSFGCGRFYRCMYLYAFRTSNACKMYRSQDKARKEEYEEETSAKTNLNRLEPLYVLLCVRIFRRFSISFICLGSACHSILDLRESKLYQRTMKQPFDKMSNMEENIVIFSLFCMWCRIFSCFISFRSSFEPFERQHGHGTCKYTCDCGLFINICI